VVSKYDDKSSERWSFIFSNTGALFFYKTALILSLVLVNKENAATLNITAPGKTYNFDIDTCTQVISGLDGMDCCKFFYQKFGDSSGMLRVRPILFNEKMDVKIEFSLKDKTLLLLYGSDLEKSAASYGERVTRVTCNADALLKQSELWCGSVAQEKEVPVACRGKKCDANAPSTVSDTMVRSSLCSNMIELWYREVLDGTRETCVMKLPFSQHPLKVLVEQFANTAVFSLVYEQCYNSAAAIFDVGHGPIKIEVDERDYDGSPQLHAQLLNEGGVVGAFGVQLSGECALTTRVFDSHEMPPRGWSVPMILGTISSRSIERYSRLAFNYAGIPVCRILGKDLVEVLSFNTDDRKLYVSSRFLLAACGGELTVSYEVMRRRQYAVRHTVFQEVVSDTNIDMKDFVVDVNKPAASTQIHWKDFSFCMGKSEKEGSIDFAVLSGGHIACKGCFPIPGSYNMSLWFYNHRVSMNHIYFLFGGLKNPKRSLIHLALKHFSLEPIVWQTAHHSCTYMLFGISALAWLKTLAPVQTYFECSGLYIWHIVHDSQNHPVFFPFKFAHDNTPLYPTHYGMQWDGRRLTMSLLHKSGANLLVLGRLYIDECSYDHPHVQKYGQDWYSLGFWVEKPGGQKRCLFWLAPHAP